MKKSQKSQHFLKLILLLGLTVGSWALFQKNHNHKILVDNQSLAQTENTNYSKDKINEAQREPSSIAGPDTNTQNSPAPALSNQDWNKKLSHQLHYILDESEYELVDIKSIKPVEIKKSNYTIKGEKVLITLKNKQGLESSFNAVVNTRTGQIIQTWNRTHFERKSNTLLQ